ncbi:hypothetical protein BDW22DRAFT_1360477 [Trametopsis cervina]|nr:hypothetical protein BDW22DRAFT_1360477 [Trametopsis cervina]
MQPESRTHTPPPLSGTHDGPDTHPSPPSVNEQPPYVGGNPSPFNYNHAPYAMLVHDPMRIRFEVGDPPQGAFPLIIWTRADWIHGRIAEKLRGLTAAISNAIPVRYPLVPDPAVTQRAPGVHNPQDSFLEDSFLEPVLGNIWEKNGWIVMVTNPSIVVPSLEKACSIIEQRLKVLREGPGARPEHAIPCWTGYWRAYEDAIPCWAGYWRAYEHCNLGRTSYAKGYRKRKHMRTLWMGSPGLRRYNDGTEIIT